MLFGMGQQNYNTSHYTLHYLLLVDLYIKHPVNKIQAVVPWSLQADLRSSWISPQTNGIT